MRIREWIAENIGYRFFGCLYNKSHDHIFDFIQTKIPKDLLHRKIYDLGCGDGGNTVRVQKVFQAKEIVGYDHNDFLLKRAKKKGILVKKFDFNDVYIDEMKYFLKCVQKRQKTFNDIQNAYGPLSYCVKRA